MNQRSKPLIQRLSSPPLRFPHLKWQRSVSMSSKPTERVDGSLQTKPLRPAKSSRLSLIQRLRSLSLNSTTRSVPISAFSSNTTGLLQMHRTETCQETLKRKRTPPLEPNEQHLRGRQMERGKSRSKTTPISPGSSGNTCLTTNLAIVSVARSNSSGFSQETSNSPNRQSL